MFIVTGTSVSSVIIEPPPLYNFGDNVTLLCIITLSHPIGPNISSLFVNWSGGDMVGSESHTEVITEATSIFRNVLILTKVTPTDAGVYNCTASIHGSTSGPISRTVDLCLRGNFCIPLCNSYFTQFHIMMKTTLIFHWDIMQHYSV